MEPTLDRNRISSLDSRMDMIAKLSEGNIGSATCLMELIATEKEIDPDAGFAGVRTMLNIDALGIYGAGIYVIWNDRCKRDMRLFVLLFRAYQLGMIPPELLVAAANDRLELDINFDKIDADVRERLPRFMKTSIGE